MEQYNVFFGVGAIFVIVLGMLSIIRLREGREVVSNETFWWTLLLGAAFEAVLAAAPIVYRMLLQSSWQDKGLAAGVFLAIKLLVFFDRKFPVVYRRN